MKRFILRLSVFAIMLVILLALIELIARKAPNTYKDKERTMLSTLSDSVEVLVLGSSHNFYGLNPQLIKKSCYNLANTSQTIYYDDYLLSRYINGSLKFEITAKRLYAASQRVL